jgi:hypothetical protein
LKTQFVGDDASDLLDEENEALVSGNDSARDDGEKKDQIN